MTPDFNKSKDGLLPVVIQHIETHHVLMVGYMNKQAFIYSRQRNRVTFFSRSKNRLWTKGETSGHFLNIVDVRLDCDSDAILMLVHPVGPTCHRGTNSCFDEFPDQDSETAIAGQRRIVVANDIIGAIPNDSEIKTGEDKLDHSNAVDAFTIYDLEKTIHQRIDDKVKGSYTYSLVEKGINKVAQKVGEEAVETVIDAINGNDKDFLYEAGDLMYHYLVLLKAKGFSIADIEKELQKRK
ncbi:MAG: bifunctional phosphoribosyl-AMP cyclohydrolase/phosphoribosyl-ATP diphosphatase HisIE [Nonlabens sp.]